MGAVTATGLRGDEVKGCRAVTGPQGGRGQGLSWEGGGPVVGTVTTTGPRVRSRTVVGWRRTVVGGRRVVTGGRRVGPGVVATTGPWGGRGQGPS